MSLSKIFSNRKVTAIVIIILLAGGIFLIRSMQGGLFFGSGDTAKTKGSGFAKVTIVEYSDFQCPACARAQPVLTEIMETYKGKVKVEFRHFPLRGHRWAKVTHQAAECAARQNKFWPFHDKLFQEQNSWSYLDDVVPVMLQFAKEQNLNVDKFGKCMTDEGVTKKIMKERDEGVKNVVRSTPTFFINGERFVGGKELDEKGKPFIRKALGIKE